MTLPGEFTRRNLFVKIGLLFNGIVGVILAVPVVRYLLSPVAGARKESEAGHRATNSTGVFLAAALQGVLRGVGRDQVQIEHACSTAQLLEPITPSSGNEAIEIVSGSYRTAI